MKLMLYVQRNKRGLPLSNPIGVAVDFNYDRDGTADCFYLESQRFVARLKRAKIDIAGADGMMLSGVEGEGLEMTYQEWWLCPLK